MSGSDRTLAARLLDGDTGALDEFFRDQVPRLYRFARRRLGGRQDLAEEVVQETLVKVIDKLDSFRGESALSTWMCTVCWRVIQDSRARDKRIPETPLVDDDHDFRASAIDEKGVDDPETAFLKGEHARRVHEVLDALPSPYGDALEWKYIEGQPVKEIAHRLGVSPKAAESMLVRARVAFRKVFDDPGKSPAGEDDPPSSFQGAGKMPS